MKRLLPFLFTMIAMFAANFAAAQTASNAPKKPSPSQYKLMNLETTIGSFKTIDGYGKFDLSFTGSVLVSRYKGTKPVITGNVRVEYQDEDKTVYFGTGTISLNGEWRGIQWFGRNMKARWFGFGLIRIFGEFDSKLQTGLFWYGEDGEKSPWLPGGMTLTVPQTKYSASGTATPVEKPKTTSGGK